MSSQVPPCSHRGDRAAPHGHVWRVGFWLLFAPLLISVAGFSCEGANLSALEVVIADTNRISVIDQDVELEYSVWFSEPATSFTVRATTVDPAATVSWTYGTESGVLGVGGGEATIDLEAGASVVELLVEGDAIKRPYIVEFNPACPEGSTCSNGGSEGVCVSEFCQLSTFPCTEQGILDAIAVGGGPHFFDCPGSTVINTTAEIVVDNDVILDGRQSLTLDAGFAHRVISTVPGSVVELRRVTITQGFETVEGPAFGAGIFNQGDLTLRNVNLVGNGIPEANFFGGIFSGSFTPDPDGGFGILGAASLTMKDCTVTGNSGWVGLGVAGGVSAVGSLDIVGSTIADNGPGPEVSSPASSGFGSSLRSTVRIADSTVSRSANFRESVFFDEVTDATIVRSTLSSLSGERALRALGTLNLRDSLVRGTVYLESPVTQPLSPAFVVENTTISQTGTSEPALLVAGSESLVLVSSTVVGSATGLDASTAVSVQVSASVVVPGCAVGSTPLISGGYNLDTDGTCGLTGPGDATVTSAELDLGPLQDNGGPTESFLPGPESAAIDAIPDAQCLDAAGGPLTADQRGTARPQGPSCDVGAVEAVTF